VYNNSRGGKKMKHKKIAQAFNKTGRLWIERPADDEFLVSDLILMLKLDLEGYKTFINKWSGYKKRAEAPTLQIGDAIKYDAEENEYNPTAETLGTPASSDNSATVTEISFKGNPLFIAGNRFGCINSNYLKIFENKEFGYKENSEVLTIIDDGKIVGVLKPYKLFDRQSQEIKEQLKYFSNVLQM